MEVKAINTQTEEVETTTTSEDGSYKLTLPEEKYIIAFMYDNDNYYVTTYQAKGVSEDVNSDVVTKTLNIEGKDVNISNVSDGTLSPEALSKLPTYNVIPSNANINPQIGDLKAISINDDPIYHFISKDSTISIDENLQILNVRGNEENTCNFTFLGS
jgi:hypothetical protein